jgi:uncharacterized membrane protein YccC
MLATSVLSIVMVKRVSHLLDELSELYAPINAHLTRINTQSLERGLPLRRMVISKMQEPPDVLGYKSRLALHNAKGAEVESEAQAARKLINAIIEDASTPSDNAALARIENRIENLSETRRQLAADLRASKKPASARLLQRTRKTSLPRKWRDWLSRCAATASLSL